MPASTGRLAHFKRLELAFEIHRDVPTVLIGDVHRIRHIVRNLVGNAIKFTENGEVVVELDCHSTANDRVQLQVSVRDTGIGIPPKQSSTIFDGFQDQRHGGVGLGLPIASRLVELMNGTISVQSEPGIGSTFFFTAQLAVAVESQSIAKQQAVLNDVPVLIVDDKSTDSRRHA